MTGLEFVIASAAAGFVFGSWLEALGERLEPNEKDRAKIAKRNAEHARRDPKWAARHGIPVPPPETC
jgi:hypothetical protein